MDRYLQELNSLLSEPRESVRERERTEFDRQLAQCGGNVVLFGAGNLGRKSLACLRSVGIEPLAFCDNSSSKWGTLVDGVQVISPSDAAERHGRSALFLVTIWSLGHSFTETQRRLEMLGCVHIVCSSPLRWKFARQMLPDYCQDIPHRVYEQAADVLRAAALWGDEYSRREYLNQVRWRALGDQGALSPPVTEESYFLDSLYELSPQEVFIDCGAYDGDTIRQFLSRTQKFKRVLAIEADPSNYTSLLKWIGELDGSLSARVHPLNVAVGSHSGKLRFHATGAEGAHLSSEGEVTVECARIDDLFDGHQPTFIKMDIEGAEMDALQGAKGAISNRPLLSICVYHRQNDLWCIPNFIHELAPDYKFFLRPHDVDGWQLVCYAIPGGRLKG